MCSKFFINAKRCLKETNEVLEVFLKKVPKKLINQNWQGMYCESYIQLKVKYDGENMFPISLVSTETLIMLKL